MERSRLERHKFLGACGMFRESFRVITARKKLFAQITLALILPLCALLLAQSTVTQLILLNTLKTDGGSRLDTDGNIPEYMALLYNKYGWVVVLAIKVVYFTLVVIFSLLATSAVVYMVACVYISKDATFKKVMTVVPKVWLRLIVTFLWIFLVFVVYTLIFVGLLFLCLLFSRVIEIVLLVILVVAYVVGIVYITIVSELAYVVSLLEDVYGRKALSRSKALLKGKLWTVVGLFVLLSVCSGLVEFGFEVLVVLGLVHIIALKVLVGVVIWFLFAFVTLVGLVTFIVIYFVCKSYLHEDLDMAIIADHLNFYDESKYAQFEQSQV
ncbi:hypothetical protein CDL15_Pgr011299 [Punica granatum]|uniref:Uncharacterized protein n=1 Tax=Punica granatum TaxID=22663 RepID=A0A218WGM0_PUNGR|nr:hypothetical protein CDL15_Pgr011299 [Punica granatum]PKI40698.1 hypothetical protein CRG98_038953 [Punica granatum]